MAEFQAGASPDGDGVPTPEQMFHSMNMPYEQSREEFDPIFYLIGVAIFLLLFTLINRDGNKQPKKTEEEQDPKKRIFTKEELSSYDGNGPEGTIYIACNELVFDVTDSPFYQKGGDYEKFAGRDMTMAAAYHSTEDKYLNMEFHPDMRLQVTQDMNI